MTAETEAYIKRLDNIRTEVMKAIQGSHHEELDWVPLPKDTSSLCVLATHMAGAESFWLHQVVGGIDVHRNRDAEFAAKGRSAAELDALLAQTGETTRKVLSKLSGEELGRTKVPRPGASPMTLREAVLHTIEHLCLHLGHLSLTKQLYAARKG